MANSILNSLRVVKGGGIYVHRITGNKMAISRWKKFLFKSLHITLFFFYQLAQNISNNMLQACKQVKFDIANMLHEITLYHRLELVTFLKGIISCTFYIWTTSFVSSFIEIQLIILEKMHLDLYTIVHLFLNCQLHRHFQTQVNPSR